MKEEKIYSATSGYLALFFVIILIVFPVLGLIFMKMIWLIVPLVLGLFGIGGFVIVNPNESSVLVLFGAYKGTTTNSGCLSIRYAKAPGRWLRSVRMK